MAAGSDRVTAAASFSFRAILQRLGDMRDLNVVGAVKVGDGAAQLEHAVIAARAQLQPAYGERQNLPRLVAQNAEIVDLADRHVAVGEETGVLLEALHLTVPRRLDAPADIQRAFRALIAQEFVEIHARDFDVNVDAVENRP